MGRISLNSFEGIGSSKHIDGFEWDTTEVNSQISMGEKQSGSEPVDTANFKVSVLYDVIPIVGKR